MMSSWGREGSGPHTTPEEVPTSVRWHSEDDAPPQNGQAGCPYICGAFALLVFDPCASLARRQNLRKDQTSMRLTRPCIVSYKTRDSGMLWRSLTFFTAIFSDTIWHPQLAPGATALATWNVRSASWRIATTWFSSKLENEKTCDQNRKLLASFRFFRMISPASKPLDFVRTMMTIWKVLVGWSSSIWAKHEVSGAWPLAVVQDMFKYCTSCKATNDRKLDAENHLQRCSMFTQRRRLG